MMKHDSSGNANRSGLLAGILRGRPPDNLSEPVPCASGPVPAGHVQEFTPVLISLPSGTGGRPPSSARVFSFPPEMYPSSGLRMAPEVFGGICSVIVSEISEGRSVMLADIGAESMDVPGGREALSHMPPGAEAALRAAASPWLRMSLAPVPRTAAPEGVWTCGRESVRADAYADGAPLLLLMCAVGGGLAGDPGVRGMGSWAGRELGWSP